MKSSGTSKSQKVKRAWHLTVILVAVLIGALRVALKNHHRVLLLKRASPVLTVLKFDDLNDLILRGPNEGVPATATLSDSEWLVGEPAFDNALSVKYSIRRFDILTRSYKAEASLTALVNRNGMLIRDLEPSQDGRWVAGTLMKSVFSSK